MQRHKIGVHGKHNVAVEPAAQGADDGDVFKRQNFRRNTPPSATGKADRQQAAFAGNAIHRSFKCIATDRIKHDIGTAPCG